MSNPKHSSGKPTALENGSTREPDGWRRGYFLSLTLENVRCFGPKQTLDLSDGNGKPAPWTVILGVNGTGKTTVLQSLVGFEQLPRLDSFGSQCTVSRFLDYWLHDLKSILRSATQHVDISVEVAGSWTLSAPPAGVATFGIKIDANSMTPYGSRSDNVIPSWCCAYGAGRRVGSASESEFMPRDPTASLFFDNADLRNPEEWLLQLEYAAMKRSANRDQQRARFAQVKELLLSILPEIDDIHLISSGGTNPKARAEFKTPDGWVPLRNSATATRP